MDDVTLDRLTADVSVFQRRHGHRFSSDDTTTAYIAMQLAPDATRILDLGCGLGSVLLHLAWCRPNATLVGVEAQPVSFELLQRNVTHNGLATRVRTVHGDLRDAEIVASLGADFDLVTGTPPYFPPSTATDALDEQRAYARIEYRGGVESYLATAAPLLRRRCWFVMCGDADADERVTVGAAAVGLAVEHRTTVIPRTGAPPLFAVWGLRHGTSTNAIDQQTLTLRDEHGQRTADARKLRAFSGFPER